MKRRTKLLILSVLIISSIVYSITNNLIQGGLLVMFAIFGIFIIEGRQVSRTVDFFEPLLFRCGRLEYVEGGITLLKETLLFRSYYKNKFIYLEYALMNIRGHYNEVIEESSNLKQLKEGKNRAIVNEINYAKLKLGSAVELEKNTETHREQLTECLSLIQEEKIEDAIMKLKELREEEAGNIVFSEVNSLLALLYAEENPEESAYYKLIAEMFLKEIKK